MSHQSFSLCLKWVRGSLLAAALLACTAVRAGAAEPVELDSPHLVVRYDPAGVSKAQAEAARDAAERAWSRCASLFPAEPAQKITLNLSPDFVGATAFARPGDLKSTDPKKASLIGIRLADMDYLGVGPEYVLTHEMAHVFSGRLAETPFGEGIADWAAGAFYDVPMAPWWGAALSREGIWVDPDALFVTGDYEAGDEVDARTRAAEYTESALLVRFLVKEFGWSRFSDFATRYAEARHTLRSNRTARAPGGWSPFERRSQRTAAPNAERVRRLFSDAFGERWEALRDRWMAEMAADPAPPATARRLLLGEGIYGSLRNYEMWVLRHEKQVSDASRARIRAAFTEANRAMLAGDLERAESALNEARRLLNDLKDPQAVAGSQGEAPAGAAAAPSAAASGSLCQVFPVAACRAS